MSLTDLGTLDTLKRCAKAAELTYAGQFEQARETLGELWRGIGERPPVDIRCWLTHSRTKQSFRQDSETTFKHRRLLDMRCGLVKNLARASIPGWLRFQ